MCVGIAPRPFVIHKPTAATPVGIVLAREGGTIKVDSLREGGLAAACGLQVGDTVQTINGKLASTLEGSLSEIKKSVGDVTVGIAPRAGATAPPPPQAPKFDINTGQPIQQAAAKFDVYTGKPIAEPVQPQPAAQPVQPQQAAQPVQPQPAAEPVQPQQAAQPVVRTASSGDCTFVIHKPTAATPLGIELKTESGTSSLSRLSPSSPRQVASWLATLY